MSWTAGDRASNSKRNQTRKHASWTPWTAQAGLEIRLLCDPCHDLCAQQNLSGWVRRSWTTQAERAPWLAHGSPQLRTDARAHLAGTLRQLLDRLDDGRRITLG
jgi:hypothetical protein